MHMLPTRLYITIGLPGSGKSHWGSLVAATMERTVVVCKDDIRTMLHAGRYVYDQSTEPTVKRTALAAMVAALNCQLSVIMDETNLRAQTRQEMIAMASMCTPRPEVWYVLFPELDNCLERRMQHARGVPRERWESVIENMKKILERPTREEGYQRLIVAHDTSDISEVMG